MGFSQPTPELPVRDVQFAQKYYRDRLGFEIGWYNEAGKIGAVSNGDCSVFFREASEKQPPSTFWVFCEDLEAAQADMAQRGANITDGQFVGRQNRFGHGCVHQNLPMLASCSQPVCEENCTGSTAICNNLAQSAAIRGYGSHQISQNSRIGV